MKKQTALLSVIVLLTVTAALAYDETVELFGISFHVTSTSDGSSAAVSIAPSGLEIDNRPMLRKVDGAIVRAEVADLNADQSPEIYVYVRSEDKSARGTLVAYAANRKKSLSEIYLAPIADNPEASKGFRGHDEFAVVESTLVQRFPVYRDGDTDDSPTGGTRQLQYKLAPGEAGWILRLDKIVEF